MGMTDQSSFFQLSDKFSLIISSSLIFFSALNILQTNEHSFEPEIILVKKTDFTGFKQQELAMYL